jgi:hypothetical protein
MATQVTGKEVTVMAFTQRELNRAYVLHGCGGLTTVQARLAELAWNFMPAFAWAIRPRQRSRYERGRCRLFVHRQADFQTIFSMRG